ncbi:MAG: hypothetical protein IPK15_01080 [Verrucomicrobia bacterium]|nr:hypothetical protein [Verrucomicrobiota bacterium]
MNKKSSKRLLHRRQPAGAGKRVSLRQNPTTNERKGMTRDGRKRAKSGDESATESISADSEFTFDTRPPYWQGSASL